MPAVDAGTRRQFCTVPPEPEADLAVGILGSILLTPDPLAPDTDPDPLPTCSQTRSLGRVGNGGGAIALSPPSLPAPPFLASSPQIPNPRTKFGNVGSGLAPGCARTAPLFDLGKSPSSAPSFLLAI